MSGSSDKSSSSDSSEKGFTLIELLIVIAIMGVLAAGVLFAIDPVDRIRSANDSLSQKDVSSIANAAEAYAATHDGVYAATRAILVTNGDLKVDPAPPATGYSYTYAPTGASPNYTGFTMVGTLRSKKFTSGSYNFFMYSSATGKACPSSSATTQTCQP